MAGRHPIMSLAEHVLKDDHLFTLKLSNLSHKICDDFFYFSVVDHQRRKSVCNFGGTDLEKFGESASAEGAKLRLPKARSPSRLGGLRERRKLPQRGRRDF